MVKNYPSAYKWHSLAAAQGYKDSARMLDELKIFMTPEEITEGKRLVKEFVPRRELSQANEDLAELEFIPLKEKPGSTSN